MRRISRSPIDESTLAGNIVIEKLPRRSITSADIHTWLKKYGSILDISLYEECAIVQFSSDLEAAGAVQCEDGGQFFGAIVSVKHAEPGILSSIRRRGPLIDRFPIGSRRYGGAGNIRDRDRDRERDRERTTDRDRIRERDRVRPRERDGSPRSRPHDEPYDRRRRRDDTSPRKRSRSPIGQRGDRRYVHPLNWLSEVAGTDKTSTFNGSTTDSKAIPSRVSAPYAVAIVAVQHELVTYAEMIEKRVAACLKAPDYMDPSSVRTHIVVLLSADHLTPCLGDLTKDGVPFAIICTTTNWSHGSCTVRILYAPTQQEHRNMPLDDAMALLQKEYDAKLALERQAMVPTIPTPAVQPPVAPTPPSAPIISSDDHTFLAPSREMSTLLRMLADSRILSIGELDEIAAFVQERKRRLEGRRPDAATADTRTGNTADLKSRILNMIYPQNSGTAVPVDQYSGMGTYQGTANSVPMPPTSLDQNARLGAGLANPVVQQAIDNLMGIPANRFAQPSATQITPQQGANIDVMSRMGSQKGSSAMSSSRTYGQPPRGSYPYRGSDADYMDANQQNDGNSSSSLRFSSYKSAGSNDGSKASSYNTSTLQKDTGYKPTGGASRSNQNDDNMDTSTSSFNDNEAYVSYWRGRKRIKRRGGSRAGQSDRSAQQQQQQPPPPAQQVPQRQPVDLMSSTVTPVGTVAEAYGQTQDSYQYSRKTLLMGTTAGTGNPFYPPSAPFYLPPSGSYPGQPYY